MEALNSIKKIILSVVEQLKSTFQLLSLIKKMNLKKTKGQQPAKDIAPQSEREENTTSPELAPPNKEQKKEAAKKKKTPVPPLNILTDSPLQEDLSWSRKGQKWLSFLKFPNKNFLSNPYIAALLMVLLLAVSVLGFWGLLDIVLPSPSSQRARTSNSLDSLKEESSPQKNKDTSSKSSVEDASKDDVPKNVTKEPLISTTFAEAATPSAEAGTSSDEHIPYQPPLDLEKTKGFLRTVNPHFFAHSPPINAKGIPYNIPPRIGIIVYDVGINEWETDFLLSDLPEEVSFSLSPYSTRIDSVIGEAKILGHTVLIQMPWENEHIYTDQGYLTVCTGLTQEKMMEILNTYQRLGKTADGFFAQGGEKLMLNPDELSLTLKFITATKNCLIAPPDVLMTSLHEIAAKEGINYVSVSLLSPKFKDISAIESLAKRTGFAIIAFPAKPNVSTDVKEWIDRLDDLDIEVVPVSKIIKEKK